MDLKVAEGKASPKRDFRSLRDRNQRTLWSNLLEVIAQVSDGGVVSQSNEDGGVVRMKIVVRKQDLKQVLEVMRGDKNSAHQPSYSQSSSSSSSLSVEQRLILLRRKHLLRESRRCSWSPVLQTIPEEL